MTIFWINVILYLDPDPVKLYRSKIDIGVRFLYDCWLIGSNKNNSIKIYSVVSA